MVDYTKESHAIIPLSPAAALQKAEELLADTGVSFSTPEARGIIAGLVAAINTSKCFATAIREGRKTFVLIDKDPAAAFAIREWVHMGAKVGHRKEKVEEALRIAGEFDAVLDKKTAS